jgi:hypothetical protein
MADSGMAKKAQVFSWFWRKSYADSGPWLWPKDGNSEHANIS